MWTDVNLSNDPDEMWAKWKNMLRNHIDKYAPLTLNHPGSLGQLSQNMCKRDFLKKKAKQAGDHYYGNNINTYEIAGIMKLKKQKVNTLLTTSRQIRKIQN